MVNPVRPDSEPLPTAGAVPGDESRDQDLHPLELAHLTSYQDEAAADYEDDSSTGSVAFDPALVLIALVVISFLAMGGFTPEARYVSLWSLLGMVGIYASFADEIEMLRPTLRDLSLGLVFGALVGLPVLAVGGAQLGRLSYAAFGEATDSAVFAYVCFAMPLAETFFFRGALHNVRGLVFSGIASGIWSIFLFFPNLNMGSYPFVAIIVGICFLLSGILYGYLRERNGLFTAWTCQIAANILILFASRFIR